MLSMFNSSYYLALTHFLLVSLMSLSNRFRHMLFGRNYSRCLLFHICFENRTCVYIYYSAIWRSRVGRFTTARGNNVRALKVPKQIGRVSKMNQVRRAYFVVGNCWEHDLTISRCTIPKCARHGSTHRRRRCRYERRAAGHAVHRS